MQDALALAYMAGVVVFNQVFVELGFVVEPLLAKLTPGMSGLSQLGITLQAYPRKKIEIQTRK